MSVAEPPARPAAPAPPSRLDRAARLTGRIGPDTLLALGLGALLAAVALGAGGGLQLKSLTDVEVGLEAAGGLLGVVALLTTPRQRLHGGATLTLMAVLVALCAVSITWAVQPEDAWQEANRTLAYTAAFGSGLALVRIAPARWSAVIGATLIASLVVSGYALATKVFPATLAPAETYARLRDPFGYWNAVGLSAALGIPSCLWLGARRHGHAALNALAFPVLTVLGLTLLLAISRGGLIATAIGLAVWFAIVPLRLRGAAVLAGGAAGTVSLAAWAFSRDALTKDNVDIAARQTAGHELGLLVLGALVVLSLVGLAVGFAQATGRSNARARRRVGTTLLVLLALVPVGLAIGLASSERGLGGSISHGWRQLTDPDAQLKVDNDPGRLTAVGSVRSRYYADALKLLGDHPIQGSGAGAYATARPRVRTDSLDVRHAHGYVFQTAADLGVLGLLVIAGLLGSFLWSAGRACALLRGAGTPRPFVDAELVGLRTLLAVIVTYGVSSFVDWTWYVPGPTVLALVAAGWLAGRGPAVGAWGNRQPRPGITTALRAGIRSRALVAAALGAVLLVALGIWTTVQPQRSVGKGDAALARLDAGDVAGARSETRDAERVDPLSIEPWFNQAIIEAQANRPAAVVAALQKAVQLQPQNPAPWLRLAEYEAESGQPAAAVSALKPALYLDPRNPEAVTLFLDQSRLVGAPATP